MAKFKVSKYGQWKYPGQPTAVPTEDGRITMEGVPYPVMGYVPGQPPIIMQPGSNYQFPGKMVYEIPMAYGGDISIPDLSRPNWLDKAQKGQQVKYYDDPLQFKQANKAYEDSLSLYNQYPVPSWMVNHKSVPWQEIQNEFIRNRDPGYLNYFGAVLNDKLALDQKSKTKIAPVGIAPLTADTETSDTSYNYVYKKPTQKPVYKEKPKVESIPYREARLEMSDTGLMPMTYMPPSNTAAVLSKIKEEDMYKQAPKVIPAPNFRHGGWLDTYQDGSQVAANLPWINQQGQYQDPNGVGPTVQKAAQAKEEKLKQAVRNSQSMQLPSGAITPVMGPVEYALMAPVAGASAMKAAPIIGSALNAPIAGVSGATIGNALGALGATDAVVNRLPEIPGQLSRGEYMDAAVNAATGALDLYGANMVSPLFKGPTKGITNTYNPSEDDIIRGLLRNANRNEIERMNRVKPVDVSLSQYPYLKSGPTLSKHDELVMDSYTSGRWPNEPGFWRWYNKKEHGLDYDRPITKFYDPAIPKEKDGGWLDNYQDYNYIKYKDLSLSKGTGWLDNYK